MGETVGIAHPVTVEFRAPVVDRVAAERAITITTSQTLTGTFTWLDDMTVEWSPDGFWPAHAGVAVLAGGIKTEFNTGAALVGVVDIDAHTFTVKVWRVPVTESARFQSRVGLVRSQLMLQATGVWVHLQAAAYSAGVR
ncbi:hypothetical protein A5759_05425 [Mycobacterium sp. 852014-52144_SCH5372336]|nr:hypothetical protein A5759_05425 [Mycobacterium sp. 852014-52144_SCH5372336]